MTTKYNILLDAQIFYPLSENCKSIAQKKHTAL